MITKCCISVWTGLNNLDFRFFFAAGALSDWVANGNAKRADGFARYLRVRGSEDTGEIPVVMMILERMYQQSETCLASREMKHWNGGGSALQVTFFHVKFLIFQLCIGSLFLKPSCPVHPHCRWLWVQAFEQCQAIEWQFIILFRGKWQEGRRWKRWIKSSFLLKDNSISDYLL